MTANDKRRAMRDEYLACGPQAYYQQHGPAYRNPHEDAVRSTLTRCCRQWTLDLRRVLDLACGSGEATLELRQLGAECVEGADPFTIEAYAQRTGLEALPLSFEQIAAGALSDRKYTLIVCSYALYLLEPSRLPGLLAQLAQHSPALLILAPHKRPAIKDDWGWALQQQMYHRRVRARLYQRTADAA